MRKVRLGRTNLQVTRWAIGGIPLSTMMGGKDEETILQVFNAYAALAFENQAGGVGVGAKGDVTPLKGRQQVCHSRTVPLAIFNVDMMPAGAFHLGTIEILGIWVA